MLNTGGNRGRCAPHERPGMAMQRKLATGGDAHTPSAETIQRRISRRELYKKEQRDVARLQFPRRSRRAWPLIRTVHLKDDGQMNDCLKDDGQIEAA